MGHSAIHCEKFEWQSLSAAVGMQVRPGGVKEGSHVRANECSWAENGKMRCMVCLVCLVSLVCMEHIVARVERE